MYHLWHFRDYAQIDCWSMSASLCGVFHVLQWAGWFVIWINAVVMEPSLGIHLKIMDSDIFTRNERQLLYPQRNGMFWEIFLFACEPEDRWGQYHSLVWLLNMFSLTWKVSKRKEWGFWGDMCYKLSYFAKKCNDFHNWIVVTKYVFFIFYSIVQMGTSCTRAAVFAVLYRLIHKTKTVCLGTVV